MSGLNFNYLLFLIYSSFVNFWQTIHEPNFFVGVYGWLGWLWWICLIVSLPMIAGIIYFVLMVEKVWRTQHESVYGRSSFVEEIKEDYVTVNT